MAIEAIGAILGVLISLVALIFSVHASRKAQLVSENMVEVERDGKILDWSQDVLAAISAASSLCLAAKHMTSEEFEKKRRHTRTQLYALRDQGAVFFARSFDEQSQDPALNAIRVAAEHMRSSNLKHAALVEKPVQHVKAIRACAHDFIDAIRKRISPNWIAER